MGTEGVTGKESLHFLAVGIHGVRPVKVWKHHECKSFVPQGKSVIFLDGNTLEIPIYYLFKK